MLKSTHKANANTVAPLPKGWTEHRAPTGHSYYYNSETKQSTYTRPAAQLEPEEEELQIDYGATQPDHQVQASINALQQFHKHNDPVQPRPGAFTGGRSYQDRDRYRDPARQNKQGDRAKSKAPILNCEPWLLVRTKYGRRFVHNTETKESFWKFPSNVMMAVIEMERLEWEKKQEQSQAERVAKHAEATPKVPVAEPAETTPCVPARDDVPEDYDSDEYEEVEVTDDEDDNQDPATKRLRLDDSAATAHEPDKPPGPQEFDEDDIAWQLAQMEADESADPGYDYDDAYSDQELEVDDDGGMPLTREDKEALFRTLLDAHGISPFSTFDALIDTNTPTANAVISDDRWIALPNMSARRAAFDAWSRDRVAERNGPETDNGTNGALTKPKKLDPKVAYLRFLAKEATPKLYWPEFKRKFKKTPEMTDRYFPDKDREKLYREYITKLKSSDSDRKKEFTTLLKTASSEDWPGGLVPEKIEKDLRFYGVRDETSRKELVEGYLGTIKR